MQRLPENIHLLLVGEGPLRMYNEELSKDLVVKDRVHFLGFRNDIERILKTSDIIIQSSNWEGFGLVAVEGMAVGKPVIVSDVSGLKDIVNCESMLFERQNSNELTERIKCLLYNQSCYENNVQNGLQRAGVFNIDRMIERYIKEYKKLHVK